MNHEGTVVKITNEILMLIAEIDKFKGEWKALGNLAPERLDALKKWLRLNPFGSSTRIEGVTLTDQEIEALLSGLDTKSFCMVFHYPIFICTC